MFKNDKFVKHLVEIHGVPIEELKEQIRIAPNRLVIYHYVRAFGCYDSRDYPNHLRKLLGYTPLQLKKE